MSFEQLILNFENLPYIHVQLQVALASRPLVAAAAAVVPQTLPSLTTSTN